MEKNPATNSEDYVKKYYEISKMATKKKVKNLENLSETYDIYVIQTNFILNLVFIF